MAESKEPAWMTQPERIGSPAYVFDLDQFGSWCASIKETLGEIPLTYSMKANPFLLNKLPEAISHVEVCSPGELSICMQMGIAPEKIIYSGVMKEAVDVEEAVSYGVDILTAESLLHAQLESAAVCKLRKSPDEKRKVILRLTSGNQFGMSADDIETIIRDQDAYPGLEIYGIHYFSGTQKKMKQIKKDVERVKNLLTRLKDVYGYEPKLVEYGPGAPADYFEEPYEETDLANWKDICAELLELKEICPLGIEMGRFLASGCGSYMTRVCDAKSSYETNYLIVDGGIHHLKYFGQNMAMQIPPITVLNGDGAVKTTAAGEETVPYMLCGSLCTTADILVREAELPAIEVGDYLVFGRCGAYSVMEGTVLFLSRMMPRIYLYTQEEGLVLARDFLPSSQINMAR